jgi:hypothetical protein
VSDRSAVDTKRREEQNGGEKKGRMVVIRGGTVEPVYWEIETSRKRKWDQML